MSQALHQERLMTVIRGPHLSEKAHISAESKPGRSEGSHRRDEERNQASRRAVVRGRRRQRHGRQRARQGEALSADARVNAPSWKKAYVKLG